MNKKKGFVKHTRKLTDTDQLSLYIYQHRMKGGKRSDTDREDHLFHHSERGRQT